MSISIRAKMAETWAAVAMLLLAGPAAAWEATSSGPICLLSHRDGNGEVTVSHDPRAEQPYAIDVTRAEAGWIPAPVFAMRFDGPSALTITTDRHRLSEDGRGLRVTDRGFGNVLRGIAGNHVAIAVLGEQTLVIPLAGAAPEVQRFLDCTTAPGV